MQIKKQQQTIIMIVIVVIVMIGFALFVKESIYRHKEVRENDMANQETQKQIINDRNTESIDNTKTTEASSSDSVSSFSNNDLGISFSYPSFLGNISIEKKDDAYYLMFGKDLFLVAVNPSYEVPPRGSFFGDTGFKIKNEDYIKNYCDKKIQCETFYNDNKVLVAKHSFVDFDSSLENGLGEFPHFYIYNPKTEFKGIVISPVRLKKIYKNEDIDKAFDYIINSINIIK